MLSVDHVANILPSCNVLCYKLRVRTIIRTVVRIVGMGRMSHICNTKCSRL